MSNLDESYSYLVISLGFRWHFGCELARVVVSSFSSENLSPVRSVLVVFEFTASSLVCASTLPIDKVYDISPTLTIPLPENASASRAS
jgi:hypothetical protein